MGRMFFSKTIDDVTFTFLDTGRSAYLTRISTRKSMVEIPAYVEKMEVAAVTLSPRLPDCVKKVHIPETVTTILSGFADSKVVSITGCAGVTSIWGDAFKNSMLESITCTNRLETIRSSAFQDCIHLRTVGDLSGVHTLEACAFRNCRKLTDVGSMYNLRILGPRAFEKTSLKSFTKCENLGVIGDCAFRNCRFLKKVYLSDYLCAIGNNAFEGTSGITYTHSGKAGTVNLLFENGIIKREPQFSCDGCWHRKDIIITPDAEIRIWDIEIYDEEITVSLKFEPYKETTLDFFLQNVCWDDMPISGRMIREVTGRQECTFTFELKQDLDDARDQEHKFSFEIGYILPPYKPVVACSTWISYYFDDDSMAEPVAESTDAYLEDIDFAGCMVPDPDYGFPDFLLDETAHTSGGSDSSNGTESDYDSGDFDPSSWAAESYLRKVGYTVSKQAGLTDKERQTILGSVIDSGKMSKSQIITHLEAMAGLRRYQSRYNDAVDKWDRDIEFIRHYRP